MSHMLAQEHMGFVDALRYGTARNQVTLAAALSAIGSSQAILVLTFAGDGVWTIGSNLSGGGNNQTLWIPPGVTVNVASGVTFTWAGPLLSFNTTWKTGPGTFTYNPAFGVGTQLGYIIASTLNVANPQYATPSFPSLVVGSNVQSVAGAQPTLQVYPYVNATDGPAIDFVQGAASPINTYRIMRAVAGGTPYLYLYNTSAGSTQVVVGSGTLGVQALPTHALHMGVDDAFKASTLWSVPSDERLKTVLRDMTEGLAALQSLPTPVWFTWNGKGQTPVDSPEQPGFIAQDAVGAAPYLFTTYQDKLDPTDPEPTDIYSGNYSPLLFMLINAMKELAARVAALESVDAPHAMERIDALEAAAHGHSGGGSAAGMSPYIPPFMARSAPTDAAGEEAETQEEASPASRRRRHR